MTLRVDQLSKIWKYSDNYVNLKVEIKINVEMTLRMLSMIWKYSDNYVNLKVKFKRNIEMTLRVLSMISRRAVRVFS